MAIRNLETRIPTLQRPAVKAKGTEAPRAAIAAVPLRDTLLRTQPTPLAQAVSPFVKTPFRAGNSLELFIDGKEAYPQIHGLIDSAKKRIDMEFFAFTDDSGGRAVAEKLMKKANEGVEVNVLVDKLSHLGSDMMKDLEAAGVNVKRFTNGYKVPLMHANSITDHRKILLVDGKAGMTGGMNIAERYEKYWHDVMVKFEGPTLEDVYAKFEHNWKLSGGKAPRSIPLDLARKGADSLQVAVTSSNEREILDSFLAAFKTAKEKIFVTSPYFIDDEIVSSLKAAAKRGVKVHAVLPSVGDNPAIDIMNKSVVNDLLDNGVSVYQYDTLNPAFGKHNHVTDHFNHAKVATMDGYFSIVGTANMDRRSMALSQEINLHVDSKKFAQEVEERFFKQDFLKKAKPAARAVLSGKEKVAEKILNSLKTLF